MEKITKGHPASQSPDMVQENIELLKQLFPTIVAEGKIDIEELKALLGEQVETEEEYYRFTWAGKSKARKEANKPSTGTLRPAKEESKDWDNTQNVFIEGDNLEVLKLMQKSYAGKIKMIYIDPPYNTGKDFVYKDNYADNLGNYLSITGQTDEEGRKLSTNTETDGRYHSNWLNMMYPRLKLARNLLKDDGVIFISIDENESTNLRKMCDEIFGADNFIASTTVRANPRGRQSDTFFATVHDYLVCYAKNNETLELDGLPLSEDDLDEFDQIDDDGKRWRELGLRQRGAASLREDRPDMYFPIFVNPTTCEVSVSKTGDFTVEVLPRKSTGQDGRWMWGYDKTKNEINRVYARLIKRRDEFDIFIKDYLEKEDGIVRTRKPKTIWVEKDVNTEAGGKLLKKLFPSAHFPYPKPLGLLERIIKIASFSSDIVLDFFAGSGTLAHALLHVNSLDLSERRFICIQLPQLIENKEASYKAGWRNIADITKERIRRAGDKIEAELNKDLFTGDKKLDTGFRVFKLDSSNIRAWDGSPEALEENLFNAVQNIKDDRTEEDVLYEILLKHGLDLALPVEEKQIAKKTVYNIGAGAMFICLANGVTKNVAEGIGKWKEELQPATCRVIFKDTGLTDVEKTNAIQILRHYGITEVNSI